MAARAFCIDSSAYAGIPEVKELIGIVYEEIDQGLMELSRVGTLTRGDVLVRNEVGGLGSWPSMFSRAVWRRGGSLAQKQVWRSGGRKFGAEGGGVGRSLAQRGMKLAQRGKLSHN